MVLYQTSVILYIVYSYGIDLKKLKMVQDKN